MRTTKLLAAVTKVAPSTKNGVRFDSRLLPSMRFPEGEDDDHEGVQFYQIFTTIN